MHEHTHTHTHTHIHTRTLTRTRTHMPTMAAFAQATPHRRIQSHPIHCARQGAIRLVIPKDKLLVRVLQVYTREHYFVSRALVQDLVQGLKHQGA